MLLDTIHVDSPNVIYTGGKIIADYMYTTTSVKKINDRIVVS